MFDVPGKGRFGVSICYDMWFPETTRTLAWMGAEVILHPVMTNTIDRDVELAMARASAATNQCYFFDINVAGRLGYGRSMVSGPGGEVMHQAGAEREIIPVEVDFDYVRRVRERGWHGLGQVLKSFRDGGHAFPQYAGDAASAALSRLGPLVKPDADARARRRAGHARRARRNGETDARRLALGQSTKGRCTVNNSNGGRNRDGLAVFAQALLGGTAIAAAIATPALAQDAATAADDEIIVTATRRRANAFTTSPTTSPR